MVYKIPFNCLKIVETKLLTFAKEPGHIALMSAFHTFKTVAQASDVSRTPASDIPFKMLETIASSGEGNMMLRHAKNVVIFNPSLVTKQNSSTVMETSSIIVHATVATMAS